MLKNKDGTIYTLSRPNSLVKDQEFWDEKFILHNLKWKKNIKEDIIQKPKPEIKEIKEVQSEIKEEKKIEEPEISTEEKIDNTILIYCLPARGIEDGEVKYNDKFILDGIILEQQDLFLSFWAENNLSKNSIIYPYKFKDGRELKEFRWWKVSKSEPKESGFIIRATISNFQPYF